jgi:hypothetical protein
VAELADAHDSKSCWSNLVRVRFPPSAHTSIHMTPQKTDTIKKQNDRLFEEVINIDPDANAHTHFNRARLAGMSPATFWNRWREHKTTTRQEDEQEGTRGIER